jgi:hypothetical protein
VALHKIARLLATIDPLRRLIDRDSSSASEE